MWIRKQSISEKYYAEIICTACTIIVILAFAVGRISAINNDTPIDQSVIEESENISTVNLCVVEKGMRLRGLTGLLNEYYLLLSNDMTVLLTKGDFKKYEVGKYYDFELVEKVTVRRMIKKQENKQIFSYSIGWVE